MISADETDDEEPVEIRIVNSQVPLRFDVEPGIYGSSGSDRGFKSKFSRPSYFLPPPPLSLFFSLCLCLGEGEG